MRQIVFAKWPGGGINQFGIWFNHQKYYLQFWPSLTLRTKWFWFQFSIHIDGGKGRS